MAILPSEASKNYWYLYGIKSDRKLCADIHVNLAYRWFLRLSIEDKVPDHSAMTRIRDRLGEDLFREAFEKIVEQCKAAGLVKGKQMITDATLIEADASLKSVVKKQDVGKTRQEIAAERAAAKASKEPRPAYQRHSAKTHASRTDPESSLVKRSGYRPHLYCKSHCTIDGAARIITDCHVTTGAAHECTVFQERAAYVTTRFGFTPDEWVADRGYGHGPAYEFLRSKKIRAYIPLRDMRLGRGKDAPTAGFRYDRKSDRYVCPRGHKLLPHKPEPGYTRYRIKGDHCKTCPLRDSCLCNSKLGSKRIYRARYQDEFDGLHKRSGTKHFKRKIRQRAF